MRILKIGTASLCIGVPHIDPYFVGGIGTVLRSGDLGTEVGDPRAKLFVEFDLYAGPWLLRVSIDWRGGAR